MSSLLWTYPPPTGISSFDVMSEATATVDLGAFQEQGYVVMPGLLTTAEVTELRHEFAALHSGGPIPGHFSPVPQDRNGPYDPLRDYPRIMHPHQVSGVALRYLLDARFGAIVARLLDEEPIAAQSMFYFKPPAPGGRRCTRTTST